MITAETFQSSMQNFKFFFCLFVFGTLQRALATLAGAPPLNIPTEWAAYPQEFFTQPSCSKLPLCSSGPTTACFYSVPRAPLQVDRACREERAREQCLPSLTPHPHSVNLKGPNDIQQEGRALLKDGQNRLWNLLLFLYVLAQDSHHKL